MCKIKMMWLNILIIPAIMLIWVTVNAASNKSTNTDKEIYVTAEELREFNKALEDIKSFRPSKEERKKDPKLDKLAKIAEDLRQAEYHAKQQDKHLAEAKSYEKAAIFVKQHAAEIDADFGRLLMQYITKKEGLMAAVKITSLRDDESRIKLEAYAKELSNNPAIRKRYLDWAQNGYPPRAGGVRS